MSEQENKQALADFRAAIREAWSGVVGRPKLSSSEYDLTQEWFDAGVPLEFILKAIHQASERARQNQRTIYSLGVIRADLVAIKRAQATLRIGLRPNEEEGWRSKWAEDLESVAEDSANPEMAAECRELIRDLPGLSKTQAVERWREIKDDRFSRRNSL